MKRKPKTTKRQRKARTPMAAPANAAIESLGKFADLAAACTALERWVAAARRANLDLSAYGAAIDNDEPKGLPVLVSTRKRLSDEFPYIVWLKNGREEMQVWIEEGEKGISVSFTLFVERMRAAVAAEEKAK